MSFKTRGIAEQARNTEMLRNVFGGGQHGASLMDMVNTFKEMRSLLPPDDDVKALLYSISQKLDQQPQESEDTKALRQEVQQLRDAKDQEIQQLRDQLHEKDRQMYQSQVDDLKAEITGLRGELSNTRANTVSKSEYDLMDRLLGTIDQRTGDVTGAVKGFLGSPPKPLPSGEKEEVTRGIEQEVAEESGLDQLADEIFFK